MEKAIDLYTDYLLSSFGQVMVTGLSNLLDNSTSHDRITHMLSGCVCGSKDLWVSGPNWTNCRYSLNSLDKRPQSRDCHLQIRLYKQGRFYGRNVSDKQRFGTFR